MAGQLKFNVVFLTGTTTTVHDILGAAKGMTGFTLVSYKTMVTNSEGKQKGSTAGGFSIVRHDAVGSWNYRVLNFNFGAFSAHSIDVGAQIADDDGVWTKV